YRGRSRAPGAGGADHGGRRAVAAPGRGGAGRCGSAAHPARAGGQAMNRWWVLPILCAALAAGVWAEDVPEAPSAAAQAKLFQRNRVLLQTLVQGGLELAKQEDPVKRAGCCNDLAKQLANEIRLAAQSRDAYRAAELGDHLYALLHDGVAGNLSATATPP